VYSYYQFQSHFNPHKIFAAYGPFLSGFDVLIPLEIEGAFYTRIFYLGLRIPDYHLRDIG
jgi:hypothetical protein